MIKIKTEIEQFMQWLLFLGLHYKTYFNYHFSSFYVLSGLFSLRIMPCVFVLKEIGGKMIKTEIRCLYKYKNAISRNTLIRSVFS